MLRSNRTILRFGMLIAAINLALIESAQAFQSAVEAESSLAEEPFAAVPSLEKAARALDRVAVAWTSERKCGTCHTNYPYLAARAKLGNLSDSYAQVRAFFEDRVAHWDDAQAGARPRWDAEVIATADALARSDLALGAGLHETTRRALDRMWTLQKADGGFTWLKCGWPPLEHDDYLGAIVAALAVGHAPGDYAHTPLARAGIERLKRYFAKNQAPDLHHGLVLLWASTRVGKLISDDDRSRIIAQVRALERPGGGWTLASLGSWKRRDGSLNPPDAPSDGYATGLVIYTLRQAGVPASDPAIVRGVGWLLANQRSSGLWFTPSLNRDGEHYISRAGSAYAVLALESCGYSTTPNPRPAEIKTSMRSFSPGLDAECPATGATPPHTRHGRSAPPRSIAQRRPPGSAQA